MHEDSLLYAKLQNLLSHHICLEDSGRNACISITKCYFSEEILLF